MLCIKYALDGLVFGPPKFVVSETAPGYTKYEGKDHISGVLLKGKYFQYTPNPFYFDVVIQTQRLNHLPEILTKLMACLFYQLV